MTRDRRIHARSTSQRRAERARRAQSARPHSREAHEHSDTYARRTTHDTLRAERAQRAAAYWAGAGARGGGRHHWHQGGSGQQQWCVGVMGVVSCAHTSPPACCSYTCKQAWHPVWPLLPTPRCGSDTCGLRHKNTWALCSRQPGPGAWPYKRGDARGCRARRSAMIFQLVTVDPNYRNGLNISTKCTTHPQEAALTLDYDVLVEMSTLNIDRDGCVSVVLMETLQCIDRIRLSFHGKMPLITPAMRVLFAEEGTARDPAVAFVRTAMQRRRHVVSANKGPLVGWQ